MQHQYTLSYTPAILKSAVISYFRQIVGPWFPFVLAGMAIFVVYRIFAGDRSWIIGAAGGIVLLACAIIGSLLVVHLRRAKMAAKELAQDPVMLTIADEGLSFESALGLGKIPWGKVASIHSRGEVLLLQFRHGGYTSIPVASLDADGVQAIRTFVRNAGGTVA